MRDLIETAEEFLASGEHNIKNKRFNAAVSDFFKAIVILCDYLIYKDMKLLPKNHNERFHFLKTYFPDIYAKVSKLFKVYTQSYNFRLDEKAAKEVKEYAIELKNRALG